MVYLMPDENNSTEAAKTENGASPSDNLREAEQIRECLYKEQGKF